MRLSRSLFFIGLLLSSAAQADIVLNSERPISTPQIGYDSPSQSFVHGATSGHDYLLVWGDGRWSYPLRMTGAGGSTASLYAVRVDGSGTSFGTERSIPITGYGHVFWQDDHYVVFNGFQWIRLDADGRLLDQKPLEVTTPLKANEAGGVNRAVSNGSEYLALYEAEDNAHQVVTLRAALFNSTFQTIATYELLTLSATFRYSYAYDVVANGDSFLVVTTLGPQAAPALDPIIATKIRPDGSFQRSTVAQYAPTPSRVYLATNGSGYLLLTAVPNKVPGNLPTSATFNALFLDGSAAPVSSPVGIGPLEAAVDGFYGQTVHLFWNGHDYEIVYAARMTYDNFRFPARALTISPPPSKSVSAPVDLPDVNCGSCGSVSNGSSTLFFWESPFSTKVGPLVSAEVFSSADALKEASTPRFRLGRGAAEQEELSIGVNNPGVALAVWRETADVTAPFGVYAARVGADGAVLDPNALKLGDGTCDGSRPTVATDGHDFLAVWQQGSDIVGRVVSAAGQVGAPIGVSQGMRIDACAIKTPSAAWDGKEYVVVWATTVVGDPHPHIFMSRFTATGAPVDLFPTDLGPAFSTSPIRPMVASAGDVSAVVAWFDVAGLFAVRVNGSGTIDARAGSITLNGGSLDGFFWDGVSFIAVVHNSSNKDQIARLSRSMTWVDNAGKPFIDLPFASSGFLIYPSPGVAVCASVDCTITSVISDGTVQVARVGLDTAATVSITNVTPITMTGGVPAYASFLPGGTRRLIYQRRAPESGNFVRVFLRTFTTRSHAVRH